MTALCNSINYDNINGNSMNHLLRILANKLLAIAIQSCHIVKVFLYEGINLPTNLIVIILIVIMLNLRTTHTQICCYLETWKEKIGSGLIFILIFILKMFYLSCDNLLPNVTIRIRRWQLSDCRWKPLLWSMYVEIK